MAFSNSHPIQEINPNWKSVVPMCYMETKELSELLYPASPKFWLGTAGMVGSILAAPVTGGASYFLGATIWTMTFRDTVKDKEQIKKIKELIVGEMKKQRIVSDEITKENFIKAMEWVSLNICGRCHWHHHKSRAYYDKYVERVIGEITSIEIFHEYINALSWYYYFVSNGENGVYKEVTLQTYADYRTLEDWLYVEEHPYMTNECLFRLRLGEIIETSDDQQRLINVASIYRRLRERLIGQDYSNEVEASLLYIYAIDAKAQYKRLLDLQLDQNMNTDIEEVIEFADQLQMMQGDISAPIWAEAA